MEGNKTYIWTGESFTGSVHFVFNAEGALLKYDITEAQMSAEQMKWFNDRLPNTLQELKVVLSKTKQAVLQLMPDAEITFDLFWNKYDEKIRSSKKKSLKIWQKLSEGEQKKAYMYINFYNRSISNGIGKKYCETYLNAELWNN
jgi:hypothetical protein